MKLRTVLNTSGAHMHAHTPVVIYFPKWISKIYQWKKLQVCFKVFLRGACLALVQLFMLKRGLFMEEKSVNVSGMKRSAFHSTEVARKPEGPPTQTYFALFFVSFWKTLGIKQIFTKYWNPMTGLIFLTFLCIQILLK